MRCCVDGEIIVHCKDAIHVVNFMLQKLRGGLVQLLHALSLALLVQVAVRQPRKYRRSIIK